MRVSSIVKRMSFVDEIAILALDSNDKVHIVFCGNCNKVPWVLMTKK